MDGDGRLTRRESFAAVAGVATGLRGLGAETPLRRIVGEAGKLGWAAKAVGPRVAGVGRALIGTPYGGGTLDRDPSREKCVAVWEGFDCVTLVETSVALARALRVPGPVENAFLAELERIRYRDGRVDGYASRLHYTTDWLHDNAARGVLKVLGTAWPFAREESREIAFMSTHPDQYPVLKARPELVAQVRVLERELSRRALPFVPRDAIGLVEPELRDGDLVAFGTEVRGLDCSHVGMVAMEKGRPYLLHASSAQGKVVLDRPLVEVVDTGRATGVYLARPLEPR